MQCLRDMRALGLYVDRVERLAGSHKEAVALAAAEADIAADFRQENLPDAFALLRLEDMNAINADAA